MAKKEVAHIRITPGENGGHEVAIEFKRPKVDKHPLAWQEDQRDHFGPKDGHHMLAHVANHLQIPDSADGDDGDDGDEEGE